MSSCRIKARAANAVTVGGTVFGGAVITSRDGTESCAQSPGARSLIACFVIVARRPPYRSQIATGRARVACGYAGRACRARRRQLGLFYGRLPSSKQEGFASGRFGTNLDLTDACGEISRQQGGQTMTVEDVMTSDVITVSPATPIHEAARLMVEHRVSGLPVIGADGSLVGII